MTQLNQKRRTWLGSLWKVWDGLLLYLPLLAMTALALGTYWLVRTTEPANASNAAAPTIPAENDVDYFMQGFTVRSFNSQGRLTNEVFGSEARHFTVADRLEMDAARIRSVNEQGQVTTASAQRVYSNRDVSEVKLVGNAEIVREALPSSAGQPAPPPLAFRGNFLHAFIKEEKMLSDQPVQMTRGNDRFSGNAFTFDNSTRVLELNGNVRVTLQAQPSAPPRMGP